jgi:hypothetical protein
MEQFLKSARFYNALNNLEKNKRDIVYRVFEKLIIHKPNLNILTYIAVLDKLFSKDITYTDISTGTYINSIRIWNRFIIDHEENFYLLIFGENIVL